MRRSVILPARSFTWAWGRPSGGGRFPPQGLVLMLKPHRTRKIPPCLQKRILGALSMVGSGSKTVAGKESSQTLLGDQEITRLTSRSCGAFPGIGRTFAFAPLSPAHELSIQSASPLLRPDSCTCQIFGAFLKSKFLSQALPRRGWRRLAAVPACFGAGALFSAGTHCFTGKYFSP